MDQHSRPEPEQAAYPVGFAQQDRRDPDGRLADPDLAADADAQPCQEGAVRYGTAPAQGVGQRQRRIEHHLAHEGISAVHRLEADADPAAAGWAGGERAQTDLLAPTGTRGCNPPQVGVGDGQIGLLELEISAEQGTSVTLECVLQPLVEDSYRGDDRHPQGKRTQQDGEAAPATPQVPQAEA